MSAPHTTHVILGAHGAVGRTLTPLLRAGGAHVRQVARTPRPAQGGDTHIAADLRDASAVHAAVAGADVAYLLAGLPYDTATWAAEWPQIMTNTIAACSAAGTRLVFFDNVYPYGTVDGVMTEATPFNPCSRKGEVRARIATMLLDAMTASTITAMIVRAPDFYTDGQNGTTTGLLNRVVFERMQAGKKPQWLGRTDVAYSAAYVPDLARSIAWLAAQPDTWQQTWHALTSTEEVTARDLVALAGSILHRTAGIQNAPRWLMRILGLSDPMLREQIEMLYQYELPYRFSSAKLTTASELTATPYAEAFRQALTAGSSVRASA